MADAYYREDADKVLWEWLTANGASRPGSVAPSFKTTEGGATAANVLTGIQSHTSTTAATTIVTVPAGRTFTGTIAISCDTSVAAASATAGQTLGVVSVAGTNATPAAGAYWSCEARAGANAASGLVGSQGNNSVTVSDVVVVAPAANSVTIQATTTIAGTAGRMDAMVTGVLV